MTKGKEAGRIQVYVRVRPFTEKEKERREPNAIEIHNEHSLIRVLDKWRESNYFYDGVFGPEAKNEEVYNQVGKPLIHAALNGYKGTLLTYGQTGTGKTYTLLSHGGVTTRLVSHCFDRIRQDEIHNYRVTCSFLQVYQEKVYDLLNTRFVVDLPVREHPKRGVYVANLSLHEVRNEEEVFGLLEIGKKQLVIAETKMVRHSSRSHSIIQLIVERRLKANIVNDKTPSEAEEDHSPETVQESIMAVDETISNLLKELKQDRKSHHKGDRECLKELMDKKLNEDAALDDFIVKGKINLCDLAGSERLTKTKAEGVRLTEAKYLNTSLLELGNVIHALARGNKGHVPYRNSTLTRLLQDCLGDNGKTNFIVCIAPSLSEVNETKCSLNFGLRAMRITNVARLSVEVDYKVLAERLARKLDDQDRRHKFEKLEYLREIQRLKSEVTLFRDTEHYGDRDTDKLVTVIANLSKSVQREKEQKKCLQSELVCIKRQISHPVSGSSHDVEALLLAEVLSMQMLASLNPDDTAGPYTAETLHTRRAKDYMSYRKTQETFLTNAEGLIKLMESFLDTSDTCEGKPLEENNKSPAVSKADDTTASKGNDYFRFNFSQAGAVELFSKDCSIKISPRGGGYDPCTGPLQNSDDDNNAWQGVKRMIGKLVNSSPSPLDDAPPAPGEGSQTPLDTKNPRPKSWSMSEEKQNGSAENKVPALIKHLATSKRKIERQICNLLTVVFDEQLAKDDGELPQWQEIGKKLSDLMLFKKNNAMSPTDLLDPQEDESGSLMEKCLHYVIMDKALLSCLLVLELAQLRQKVSQHCMCMKLDNLSSREQSSTDSKQNRGKVVCGEKMLQGQNSQSSKNESQPSKRSKRPESLSCKSPHSNSQQDIKQPSKLHIREGLEAAVSSPEGEMAGKSPSELATDLVQYRQSKRKLRSELREINEDTCQLENEVFASMEEKTRLEEELICLKDTVYRLKSELFHLKLEKSNLENDLLKSKSAEDSDRESDQSQTVSDRTVGVLTTELSDVLEVSQESVDSENSSQMSEGNEQRESFLKSCLASMSHVYTLVPSPEDDTLTEEEITETEGHSQDDGSVTDTDICDSDEDIVITKLARAAQEAQPNSHGKAKRTKAGSSPAKSPLKSPTRLSGFPVGRKSNRGHIIVEGAENEDFNITITDPEALQCELKKRLREVKELCASYNSLEEELIKAAIQLSEANQKVEDLQIELNEEKQNCEEIRTSYMDVKDKNDVLDNKVVTLRGELERVLRENEGLVDSQSSQPANNPGNLSKEAETSRAKSPSQALVKTRTRSPARNQSPSKMQPKNSQGKTPARKKSIDLRTPPQQKETPPRQLRLIHISEENAELKTKLEKFVQEKQLMEKKRVGNEDLLDQLHQSLSSAENDLKKVTEELSEEAKRRVELQKEIEEKKIVISNLVSELQGRMKKLKPTDAAKIDEELSQIKLQLSKTSKELEWQRSKADKLEKEIETSNYLNEDLECNNSTLEGQVAKLESDILKWKNELDSVVSECQVFEAELALSKKQQFDIRKEMDILRTDNERLWEENSFLKELKRKLETDYQQRKERTKVAEGETLQLQRANSELRSKLDSMQEYQDQLRDKCSKAKDEAERNMSAQQNGKDKELEQTPEPSHQPDQKHEKNNTEVNSENKRRTGIPKPVERRKNRERSPSTRGTRYSESKIASKVGVPEMSLTKRDEETRDEGKVKQHASKETSSEPLPQCTNQIYSENTQCSNVKQISDNQTATLQRQLLELEKVLSMYKMDLDKAQAKTESLTTELEIAHAERKDLERRLAEKENVADEFDIESYKDIEERYETLTTEYNALLEENSKLQLRLLDVDKERDGMRNGLSQVENENNVLKQELVSVDSNRIQLEMAVQELELKSKEWEQNSSRVQDENKRLNELVNKMKDEEKKLIEMLKTKEYENKTLQATSFDERQKRQRVEEDLTEARNGIIKLELELKQAISEKEKKQLRLTQSENDRDALKIQLNDNIEKAASLEIQLMEIRCFNDGLSQELEHTKVLERQDEYKLQEATVSRDLMEKRLTEALKSSHTLQSDLKECQEKVRDLTERVNSFKSQTEQSQYIQGKCNVNVSDELLQKQIKEELVKINNLECLLSASKTQVNELTQKSAFLEKELSQAKETVNVKQNESIQLEKKMTDVASENDKLRNQLETTDRKAKEFSEKLLSLEAKITCAKDDAGCKQIQLELAEKRLVEELKKTQKLQSKKLTYEKKLEDFENRVSVLMCEVKQAKEALDSEKVRNEQLEKQQQELVQNSKKQSDEINETRKEKDELKNALNKMNSETHQLNEKIAAQLKEIDVMERNHTDALQRNQNLRNDLENSEKRLRVLEEIQRNLKIKEQMMCDKETEIENLKKELEISNSNKETLQIKSRVLEEELSVFREETSSLKHEKSKLHKEIQDTKETERKINEELDELKTNIARLATELKSVNDKNAELRQQLLTNEDNPSNFDKNKFKLSPENLAVDKNKKLIKKDDKRKKSMKPINKKNKEDKTESQFGNTEMRNQNVSETAVHFTNMEKENKITAPGKCAENTTTTDLIIMKPENENAKSDEEGYKGISIVESVTTLNEEVNLSKSQQSAVSSSSEDASLETIRDGTEVLNHEHPAKDSITIEAMGNKICQMAKESLLLENKTARNYLQLEQALAKAAGQNKKLAKQFADSKDENIQLQKLIDDIKMNEKAEYTLSNENNAINDVHEQLHFCASASEQMVKIKSTNHVSEPDRSMHTTMNTYAQTNTDNLHPEMEETKLTVSTVTAQVHSHTHNEMAIENQSSQVSALKEKSKMSVSVACSQTCSSSTHTANTPTMSPESKGHLVCSTPKQMQVQSNDQCAIMENMCDTSVDTCLLREERNMLVDELKEIREKKKQLENDLLATKTASVKLQEDHKLLLVSYRQEKETLLMEIEVNRNEAKDMRMKLTELNESKTLIEGLQQRNGKAEKLISELEKDLMEQSNAKNDVEKDLWASRNKIKEILELEQKLKVLTGENDEMAMVIRKFKEIKSEKEIKESSCQTTRCGQDNVATQAVQNSNSEESQTEDQVQPIKQNSSIQETVETKEIAVQVDLLESSPDNNTLKENQSKLDNIDIFENNTVDSAMTPLAEEQCQNVKIKTKTTTNEIGKIIECRETEDEKREELKSLSDTMHLLTSRVDELKYENKELLNERIAEDEENSQLQNSLVDALQDIKQAHQENKRLRSEKASVEIQLSDAVEEKNTMEAEFLRAKHEAEERVRDELGTKISELSQRYSKLETVLSCVLEENACVETQITTLREENAMLRDYKITEISDTCTQITPRSTEDEEEDQIDTDKPKKKRNAKSKHNGGGEDFVNIVDSTDDASLSSAETQTPTPTCVPHSRGHDTVVSLYNLSNDSTVSSQGSLLEDSKKNTANTSPLSSPQQSENLSMAVCTDSSQLGSISELESPSSSSVVTSASEDSSYPSKHAFDSVNRLNSEIAQLKCDNTILENNLSIIKGQNSDLQSQVQKHVSRNHGLKQKVCDRTIAVKKLEREVQKVHDDNKQLQDQTSEIREELNKVEKEKIKLERNLASSKAEVKKTKTDLSYTRAECYNTMKAYTNLQIQCKKLRAKLDKVKTELCKRKELAQEDCETASERSLSSWASMSLTDLSYDMSPTSDLSRNDFPLLSENSLSPSSETSLNLDEFSKQRPDLTNQEEGKKTHNVDASHNPKCDGSRNPRANFKRGAADPSLKAHSDEEGKTGNELMLNLSHNQIRDDQSLSLMKNTLTRVTSFPSQRAKSDTSFSSQAKQVSSPNQSRFYRGAMSSAHLNAGPDWRFSFDSDLSVSSQGGSSSQGSPIHEHESTLGQRTLNGDQNLSPDPISGEVSQPVLTKAKNRKIKTILKKFNMGRKNK